MKSETVYVSVDKENERLKASLLFKLCPILLILSFAIYSMVDTLSSFNEMALVNDSLLDLGMVSLYCEAMINGLIYWLIFELIFFVYRFVIGFNLFGYIIPTAAVWIYFRCGYAIKNVVVGCISMFLFVFFPYAYEFNILVDLIFTFIVFIIIMVKMLRRYSFSLINQYVFKAYSLPLIWIYILLIAFKFVEFIL